MAGRKPRELTLHPQDRRALSELVRKPTTEQRTARRAKVLLEMAAGASVDRLAEVTDMNQATVWRICRRYEERGMQAVYDAPRSGRTRKQKGNSRG